MASPLHYLDLARENQLAETVRGEVVRLRARIFEYELIELARLETQLTGHENMLPRSAEFHDHFDRVLACEIAASVCNACNQADRSHQDSRPSPAHRSSHRIANAQNMHLRTICK